MSELSWCKKQKNGIKLAKPDSIIAANYLLAAEETLKLMLLIEGESRMWTATMNYYCKYFAAYSLLARLGITSEIHECTIALCEMLEQKDILRFKLSASLCKDKKIRIDNQYYLRNKKVDVDFDELLIMISEIRSINSMIALPQIDEIRREVAEA